MIGRPRALHIAPLMPARSGNGLAMRQGMFLDALSREFDTDLVVLPVAGAPNSPPHLPDALGARTTEIPVAGRQDTHFSLLARIADPAARVAAFRSYGRSSLAAHLSVPVLADLKAWLGEKNYDLVHIGRSYLADALQAVRGRVTTMDIDEDEWTSYREMAALLRPCDPEAASWAEAEADAISSLVAGSAQHVSSCFISNEQEAGEIRKRYPAIGVEVVPNAVAMPGSPRREHDGATLLFLGSFSYPPNADAATWFVDAIWPLMRASAQADMRFLIVGRDAHRIASLAERPGVFIRSDIEDVADAFAEATAFVAPLRAGAGTRLKLLEAAAHGVPIVSTSIGARGLPLVPGRDLLVADGESEFADAARKALSDEAASTRRAASAQSICGRLFDIDRVTAELTCRLRSIAAK